MACRWGAYDTQAAATAELAKLTQRGIRTARVVQERAAGNATYLKLPAVTDAMKQRLNDVKPAMGRPHAEALRLSAVRRPREAHRKAGAHRIGRRVGVIHADGGVVLARNLPHDGQAQA